MIEKDYLNILISSNFTTRPWLRYLYNTQKSWEGVYRKVISSDSLNFQFNTDKIFNFRRYVREVDPNILLNSYNSESVQTISIDDNNYPLCLKETKDPPLLLYYKGSLDALSQGVSVVGTRNPTSYGIKVTTDIVDIISKSKINIISGLAFGIDSIAHKTALSNNGMTCAVLAHGLDILYPYSNKILSDQIINNGGILLSEYPFGVLPERYNFPQRNRIIAGLSKVVIIPEADKKSGSLITANFGLDYGRDVVAVPGQIYGKFSSGTNQLISDGAIPLVDIGEISNLISIDRQIVMNFKECELSKAEGKLLEMLGSYPTELGDLIENTGLNTSKIIEILSSLEVKGYVESLGGEMFSRIC